MDQLAHFHALDRVLHQWQPLWCDVPFAHLRLDWEREYPDIAQTLRALTDESLCSLQDEPHQLLDLVCQHEPALQVLAELSVLPSLSSRELPSLSPHLMVDVPGRKWKQIQAFASHLPDMGSAVVDWCAGKGHLGRVLAAVAAKAQVNKTTVHNSQPMAPHCLEWQAPLCEHGLQISARAGLRMHHHCCDVMQDDVSAWLDADTHVVALHACGALHRKLLQQVLQQQCGAVSLSPCCYHLEPAGAYLPFSQAAQQALLKPDRESIRFCVQETVTAGARVQRVRDHRQAWRLGFDLLQRECRGHDSYLPIPSVPDHWLKTDFAHFCRHLAGLKGLVLPKTVNWDQYERAGWQRRAEVVRLELLRHVFRRPLELWLVFDRALALQESGYAVLVGEFCPRALTPRNILIHARRGIQTVV